MRLPTILVPAALLLLQLSMLACVTHVRDHSIKATTDTTKQADLSKAGADGPHVFYRDGKIVVKSVVMQDSAAEPRKQVYYDRAKVYLSCTVEETRDTFSFALHDSIKVEPDQYSAMPQRILVLSDIEGNFKILKTMLQGAGVMDAQFRWTYGADHLVLVGDYFDRGLQVTECLWLLYKLEAEAARSGGRVHFILGNHEVMNLSGDQRYVRNKYFENADLIGEKYANWYAADTELGRWLRSKHAIVQIGTYGFCHGGLSTDLSQTRMSLTDINRIARRWYGTPEQKITDPDAKAIFDSNKGIFWYRDMAKNKLTNSEVHNILFRYDLKRLVVGHTLQTDVNIYYRGQLICTDQYHEENMRLGFVKTLLIEQGVPYSITSKGEKSTPSVIATTVRDLPKG
jgi:Calcineurin-like phosphoesterase